MQPGVSRSSWLHFYLMLFHVHYFRIHTGLVAEAAIGVKLSQAVKQLQ
jgi:hypothetical protein